VTLAGALGPALMFAHGAVLGAMLLSAGFMMSEDGTFGFLLMFGALIAQLLLSFVSEKTAGSNTGPMRAALIFGAGFCAMLAAGGWYFQGRIVWAAVELNSLVMLALIAGVALLLLMFALMDRIRKAGEERDLRARGELP
jgi:hypothetical protein